MRHDDDEMIELDQHERELFALLPREAPLDAGDADRVVQRLKSEGFFRPRRARWLIPALAAAGLVLFALGAVAGYASAHRGSLEDMLVRRNLTMEERVLLLQRAGSAYVRAAQSYADATARVDSTAVEVASKVLMGAANAVARNSLDAGLARRLANALEPSATIPVSARKPLIWF
jgi:hypothetical protein